LGDSGRFAWGASLAANSVKFAKWEICNDLLRQGHSRVLSVTDGC
jgi:hypothetical protein